MFGKLEWNLKNRGTGLGVPKTTPTFGGFLGLMGPSIKLYSAKIYYSNIPRIHSEIIRGKDTGDGGYLMLSPPMRGHRAQQKCSNMCVMFLPREAH